MKTFKFSIKDSFFPQTFEGETQAESLDQAIQELKEDYASELGTETSEITILSIEEISK